MSGVDFDGSPIEESDEEPERRYPEYHNIWDADDLPEGAVISSDLTNEQHRELFAVRGNESIPEPSSDVERHVRPETWPNGSPMWATAPGSRIQLRMPPVPSYLRVLASRADSPEPVTSSGTPSVAQLRELWENSAAAPAQTTRPEQPLAAQVAARRLLANPRSLTVEYNRLAAAGIRYADDV